MRACNTALEYAVNTSDEAIYFISSRITGDHAVAGRITDVSYCNETVEVDSATEPGQSQQGYVLCFAPGGIVNENEFLIHPISWSSTTNKRVCRSSLMAEPFPMVRGKEIGARIHATVVDIKGLKGELDMRQWDQSASHSTGHVWLTDCDATETQCVSLLNLLANGRWKWITFAETNPGGLIPA